MKFHIHVLAFFTCMLLSLLTSAQSRHDSINVRGLNKSYELKKAEINFKVKNDTTISVNIIIGLERFTGGEWISVADNLWQDNDLGNTFIVILSPGEARDESWDPAKMRVKAHKKTRKGAVKETMERLKKGRYRFVLKWGTDVKNMGFTNYSPSFSLK